MYKLGIAFRKWVAFKLENDAFWKENGAMVIFSGPDVPGEGELEASTPTLTSPVHLHTHPLPSATCRQLPPIAHRPTCTQESTK
jgi:hypothetical protein